MYIEELFIVFTLDRIWEMLRITNIHVQKYIPNMCLGNTINRSVSISDLIQTERKTLNVIMSH